MKNNNSLKAILFFTVFIILFSISIALININDKKDAPVLASKQEISKNIFTPRESKNYNDIQLNNIGGSKNDTLLKTFYIQDKIYVLFKTDSTDVDLIENTLSEEALALAILNNNASLIMLYTLGQANDYVESFLINSSIHIFQNNNNNGIETIFDTTENKIKQTINHKNKFDTIDSIQDTIIYIYKNQNNKTLNINDNLTNIPSFYTYKKSIETNNNNFLIFAENNNIHIFNIQKNSFILTFEDTKIINTYCINNEIFIIFVIEDTFILSKFSYEFKPEFSCELNISGTNLIEFRVKTNGYLIYTIENNTIKTTFICLHGDIINESVAHFDNIKNIYKMILNDNDIFLIGKTNYDNFFVYNFDENFTEKKYMTLSNSAIYNYNLILKNNKIYLFTTTESSSFEFLDNFGKKDIFVFIK